MTETYYLAGPMTGLPDNNFPAFHQKSQELRDSGLTIINPAELDEYLGYDNWETVMQRDILCILLGAGVCLENQDILHTNLATAAPVDGIIALDGWEASRGARWEIGMAVAFHIPVYDSRLNRLRLSCCSPEICFLNERTPQ